MGIEYMNVKLASAIQEYTKTHKEELASSGIDVNKILSSEIPVESSSIEIVE